MNNDRFDDLARSLATRHSRRSVVQSLGAAMLGTAGFIGLRGMASAAPRDKVGICHRVGDGTYRYIEVDRNAVSAHEGHGDFLAREAGDSCEPIVVDACPNAVLAGAGGPDQAILVDDGLQVFVNGVPVFADGDLNNAGPVGPVQLGAVQDGDVIRVVASDTTTPRFCGGGQVIDAFTLYCPSTGKSQVLLANTINATTGGQPCGNVFYDESFTVTF